jgi:RNA polymerase sigma factor (sigma-70 family)
VRNPDPYKTRPSLLNRIKAQDEESWLCFYQQYRPLIRWLAARRQLHDPQSVDEVIQEVMMYFAKLNWQYNPELGRFRSLVLRVTEFKIMHAHRKLQQQDTLVPLQDWDTNLADAEELCDDPSQQQILELAFARLCEEGKCPVSHLELLGAILHGGKIEDIAPALGMSVGNAHVIKHRMLNKLRSQIEGFL